MLMDMGPEVERLEALYRYDLLDTPAEETFDRIIRIAQLVLDVPIVLMSLIDANRQWFKARRGLDVCETDRKISFCTYAIKHNEPFIVNDALTDERFRNNPLVTAAPFIRFYLGIPLHTFDGHNIGTLCTIDTKPRTPSIRQVAALQDLARLIIDQLELRHIAVTDSLTSAMTRRAFMPAVDAELERAERYRRDLGLILLDIDHFKVVNDTYGHPMGDTVLREIGSLCQSELRVNDCFGRLGGEEFAILMPETSIDGTQLAANRLREAVKDLSLCWRAAPIKLTASFGVTCAMAQDSEAAHFISRADKALYEAKNSGRDRVVIAS